MQRRGVTEPIRQEIPGYIYELCRKLRANQTLPEELLWGALRNRQLGGFKFHRQHPLNRYIADFYCADQALIVELDGAVHHQIAQQEYDQIRDAELQARNLRIIQIQNDEIKTNLEQVLQTILEYLEHNSSSISNPPIHLWRGVEVKV